MVRRLPVVQAPAPGEHRSAWQWAAAGAAATVVIWGPAALLTLPLGASAVLGAYAIASALSASIMVRFGRGITTRHILASATLATTICLIVAVLGTRGVSYWFAGAAYLAMLSLALPSAWLSARLTPAPTSAPRPMK